FAPFSQVHDTARFNVNGSGLGLYISRGIVERHGGRAWCESDGPGLGSAFCFALPIPGVVPKAAATQMRSVVATEPIAVTA
ncbi:MAG: ATP-binding protein, partial [Thermoplasmatota archaeon]